MPIIGIDYDKCISCEICISACPSLEVYSKSNEADNKIIFDPEKKCILCGQCIAQCPEDAIIYENMGESFTFGEIGIYENMGESFTFGEIDELSSLVPYENMFKFLAGNRSIRRYKKDKVPIEILNKVIKAMEYAPTGANMRPENFVLISDSDLIKKMSDAIVEEFNKDPSLKEQFSRQLEILAKEMRSPAYFDAPHLIIVSSPLNMMMGGFNIGNIITYGRLAAQSLGLGTCWNGWTAKKIG
jgi:NAD-dependent dihydropyrimidine dehydrogenase PreA subunit